MRVSIDVSTGDNGSGNRLFGDVTLVQQYESGMHGLILLVQDSEPNFKKPVQPAVSDAEFSKALKAHEINCCMFERGVQTLDDLLKSRKKFINAARAGIGIEETAPPTEGIRS